ncbi:diguanylate cyclase [Bacillus sp. FJAT-45350]|uniref:diguanylate cyclase n=1 Tax=Bacillus sp. FJAT-45350 TaxID=2011014 RepID=UPI00211CCF33|nr:diguanylate cyclase [Bacillus sp. FJAT-45350]
MKNIKNNKRNTIDFSKLLHVAIEDSQIIDEHFQSSILFLANEEGNIVTIREFGGFNSKMIEAVSLIQQNLFENEFPFEWNGCIIDFINIRLTYNNSQWNGLLGIIVEEEYVNDEVLRPFLRGLQYAVTITAKQLFTNQASSMLDSFENINEVITTILKDTDYTLDFRKLAKAFITYVEPLFESSEVAILLYGKQGQEFVPIEASDDGLYSQFHEYVISADEKLVINTITSNEMLTDDKQLFLAQKQVPNFTAIPLCLEGEKPFGLVMFFYDKGDFKKKELEKLSFLIKELSRLFFKAYNNNRKVIERKRRELLLQVTKKFHSSMDVGEVLGEIIYALSEMYPTFNVHLLLSHEWEVSEHLPVKQMQYGAGAENSVAENVYLTGKIQIQDVVKDKSSILFAPLRGKQGVYGVMQIKSPTSMMFPKHEIEFIEMLADIGGNALENAELYQQSRELINDLQLINSTSHQLNSNLRLSETIKFMTNQIKESFKAEQVGFIMFHSNGDLIVLEGSTEFFDMEESRKAITPLSDKIKREKDPLFIGDAEADDDYSLEPFRSFLAVPMVQSGELKGMVLVMHQEPYHFTFENFKLLQSLIHHSTLAFTNSMLHEELEKLVITDHLTRLYSRNYLDQCIQESMKTDAFGCFLLLDIDNFKQINDTYGHQVGDDIIIQVANIMKRSIRDHDIAARWGGEELAVYLPKVEPEVGYRVAERIVKSVAQETSPRVTVSCGVSYWNQKDNMKTLKLLFNIADEGLYVAKESGKNQVIMQSSLTN